MNIDKYLIAALAGVNALAISAYLMGALKNKTDLQLLGLMILGGAGALLISWAAFDGRYPHAR